MDDTRGPNVISAQGVTKRYGSFVALEDVCFEVKRGEIVGLLGPNGAGKTTLIRSLTGYFEPSAGSIHIDGVDVVADPLGVQRVIGYLPEHTPLYPEMLVQEYLDMVADVRGMPLGAPRLRLLAEAVWATGLEERLTTPIGALSKGFRQRVGLAQAILHQPKVLILDEPTGGLDPSQVVQVRELIRRLAQSATVLFSTHILSEVEQVCERAIVLLGGRICLDERLDAIRHTGRVRVAIAPETAGDDPARRLEGVEGVREVRPVPGGRYATFELSVAQDGEACRQVYRAAREAGWELCELREVSEDLETVFRRLVREHEQAGAAAVDGRAPRPVEVQA